MIGKEVRGIHHLFRLVEDKKIYYAACQINTHYIFCKIYRYGDEIFLFNNVIGAPIQKHSFDKYQNTNILNEIYKMHHFANYIFVINKNDGIKMDEIGFNSLFLLNEDFKNKYDRFCAENKKQADNVEKKHCLMHSDVAFYMYCVCNGSKNYFFWAINEFYNFCVPIGVINELLIWAENYGQLIKNLSLGTITAYKSPESIEVLRNEMRLLRKDKRIKDVINFFNTAQKKILKDRILSDRDKETLSKFGKISSTRQKNFIKKMSTVEDGDEIIKQMAYLVNVPFVWDKKSLIDYITYTDAIHAEIIFENGPIVLVKVDDYDAVKYLGKNTNWCISKNKTYWNQYVGRNNENTQYMVFDFSKTEDDVMSIIGITTRVGDGITHAHDFFNHDLMGNAENDDVYKNQFLKSFLEHMLFQKNDIISILKKDGIDISTIVSYRTLPFQWTKEEFFKYLFIHFKREDIEILSENEDKLAISVRNSGVPLCYLFGVKYQDKFDREFRNNEHIMFLDFSKPTDDFTKLQFGIVYNNSDTYESYVPGMFDEHVNNVDTNFDLICKEYGLPYDIICRTNNVCNRFDSYVKSFSIPLLNELFANNKKALDKYMTTNHCRILLQNQITCSLLNYYSFTFIKLFYDNGYTLEELLGEKRFVDFLYKIFSKMLAFKHGTFSRLINIPEEQLEAYNRNEIDDSTTCKYIGLALSLMEIFKHENNNTLAKFLYNNDFLKKSSLINHLIGIIFSTESFKESSRAINALIQYVMDKNIKEAKQIISENAQKNQVVLIHT